MREFTSHRTIDIKRDRINLSYGAIENSIVLFKNTVRVVQVMNIARCRKIPTMP